MQQQIERISKSEESIQARKSSVEQEIEQAKYNEARLVERQGTLKTEVETTTTQLIEAQELVQGLTGKVESLRGEHGEIEQGLHSIQMKLCGVRVRLETLVTRTMEEFQLDLPAKYADAIAPRTLEDGTTMEGYTPAAGMDWDAVAEEIKELREKIQRLGNVNLDSLGELDELEQRQQFQKLLSNIGSYSHAMNAREELSFFEEQQRT